MTIFAICIPALFLNIALLWTRLLGYKIQIKQAGFLRIGGIEITSKHRRASIREVFLQLHYPRYNAPYFLTLSVNNLESREPYADSSMRGLTIRLLLCPVQLGFTAGPWVECHFDRFRVRVLGSQNTPIWLGKMRDDIVHTILTGDTIRLNSLKTKTYISKSTSERSVDEQEDTIYVEKQEPVTADLDQHLTDTAEVKSHQQSPGGNKVEQDDVRVCGTASQWHIFNPKNVRVYSFDCVEADLRRSWSDDRGSMVMINKMCRWTKVAWAHETLWATGCSKTGPSLTLWGFLSGLMSLLYLFPIAIIDATEMVNIYITRMDITFDDFHIKDAQMLKEGLAKLKQEYVTINQKHPGLLDDVAWNTFRDFVNSVVAVC
ncbi:hypothetical protein BJ165DRAFT_1522016 [Panaeolus papilionaceus]|nr:hypothetical protein BJ165DRAFT_1522016 [Panaeolus papilionaceus]